MRILVVYTHPEERSFVGALHVRICERLRARGHEIDDLDLYADHFDPVMSRYTYDHYLDTDANRAEVVPYVERLLKAQALVFVYPVWHDGLPAMLKGFIDRVFLPGVIFTIDENHVFRPALHNIRRLTAVATYGASRRRTSHVGDLPRRFFIRNLGATLPAEADIQYIAEYGLDAASPTQRARFLKRVTRTFDAW